MATRTTVPISWYETLWHSHQDIYARYLTVIEVVRQHLVRLLEQQARIKALQELHDLRGTANRAPPTPKPPAV
eukprot:11370475-Prorocentrum_lima.AAC.1